MTDKNATAREREAHRYAEGFNAGTRYAADNIAASPAPEGWPSEEEIAQVLLDRFHARRKARISIVGGGGSTMAPCADKINDCVPSYRDDFIEDAIAVLASLPRKKGETTTSSLPGDMATGDQRVEVAAREPMLHPLKTWPQFFAEILAGKKHYELRRNDRDYRAGDTLMLSEWEPCTESFTGRYVIMNVPYLTEGPMFGLREGFVCMSIAPMKATTSVPGSPVVTPPSNEEAVVNPLPRKSEGWDEAIEAAVKMVDRLRMSATPGGHFQQDMQDLIDSLRILTRADHSSSQPADLPSKNK